MGIGDVTKCTRLNGIIYYVNRRTPYGWVTVRELADRFDVSTRTILRDLDVIRHDLNVPLEIEEKVIDGKRMNCYQLREGFLPSISPERATVLLLSLFQQSGSALSGHVDELKDALVSTLFRYHYNPEELASEKLQKRIHFIEEVLAEPERVGDIFDKLVQALKGCHPVKIQYFVAYKQVEEDREVEPYGLICKRQNWYLVGKCLKNQDIRVFRVDQIRGVFVSSPTTFKYPEDFNIKEHMANSWGVINQGDVCQVKLKFDKQVAHRIKNMIYHHSQELVEELADGSIIISYKVCGIKEMKTWIVQWGNTVEVLEPEWLREEMYNMAKEIMEANK